MVSLFLAYSSNQTQERMLAAASWPYLVYTQGNSDGGGGEIVFLEIRNGGSGPATAEAIRFARWHRHQDVPEGKREQIANRGLSCDASVAWRSRSLHL